MSGWDSAPPGGDSWETPATDSKEADGFSAGPPPEPGSFNAGPAPNSVDSALPNGSDGEHDGEAPASDTTCRFCKQEGHFSRDCPDKPPNDGACFNCGEQGHNKADCPNPRKFSGTCRHCGQEGHPARECPDKPADICRHCQEEGHLAKDCANSRKLDQSSIKDMNMDEAWALMKKASDEDDFDEFKEHMLEYIKAAPKVGLDELETAFRTQELRYFLYALSIEPSYDKVIVGPHGEMDRKYIYTLNKSARPRRSRFAVQRMAATIPENLARLKLAGTLEDEVRPFCHNCKEKGHLRANCEKEVAEDDMNARVVLKCTNCDGLDHRIRDCPKPRINFDACRNCGEEGHRSNECEKPRVASEDTECRSCNGKGHFSRDCPDRAGGGSQECFNCGEEGHRSSDCPNERVLKCRNCDERGHSAKECPKPRDVSRIKCNQCGEMGHFSRNCTAEAPIDEGNANSGGHENTGAAPSRGAKNGADVPSWSAPAGVPAASAPAWEAPEEPAGNSGW